MQSTLPTLFHYDCLVIPTIYRGNLHKRSNLYGPPYPMNDAEQLHGWNQSFKVEEWFTGMQDMERITACTGNSID